jgi:hypothetical protein
MTGATGATGPPGPQGPPGECDCDPCKEDEYLECTELPNGKLKCKCKKDND